MYDVEKPRSHQHDLVVEIVDKKHVIYINKIQSV